MQYVAEVVSAIADAPLRGRDIDGAIQVGVLIYSQTRHVSMAACSSASMQALHGCKQLKVHSVP